MKAYQQNQHEISSKNKQRLQAFLDGAENSYTQQGKSLFFYRDWRYAQDYYAGVAANEEQKTELIDSVKKKLR